ncbi:hypothetical protein SZN_32686 [Streptomyces zinciresistens K42]|uniref:Uncharacterized protein n=1 Tax=Streptomyces zinciresistens K42 TaxID=700597 RepID=G2GLY5_9ACTN|nr:hypothetical protein SZN_32686 [Streptomyces zinciresistens K42]
MRSALQFGQVGHRPGVEQEMRPTVSLRALSERGDDLQQRCPAVVG